MIAMSASCLGSPVMSRRKSLLVGSHNGIMNITASRRKKLHKSDFEIRAQLLDVLYDFCIEKAA